MTEILTQAGQVLSPGNAAVALISLGGSRYLMQLRDPKPNIFYPGHWGVFGGALNPGETPEDALRRELFEELGLRDFEAHYFTRFVMDFSYGGAGLGDVVRHYFVVPMARERLSTLTLGEGREMRVRSAAELLSEAKVTPYDSLAIWMHATRDSIRLTSI